MRVKSPQGASMLITDTEHMPVSASAISGNLQPSCLPVPFWVNTYVNPWVLHMFLAWENVTS